jgi:regulator of replication initiation timing
MDNTPEYKTTEELILEIKKMINELNDENSSLRNENAQLKERLGQFINLDSQKGIEQFHHVAISCFSIDDLADMYECSLIQNRELQQKIQRLIQETQELQKAKYEYDRKTML